MSACVAVAQELLAFFGGGQVTVANVLRQPPDLLFVLGAHEARTALAAARLLAQLPQPIPVAISGGGQGRGSWFLDHAVRNLCLLRSRPAPLPEERQCEATLLARLFRDEGVPVAPCDLERRASHSEENWRFSLPILTALCERLALPRDAVVGVVQSPLNRRRALHTGRHVLQTAHSCLQLQTIEFPVPDLRDLSEQERTIELFRLFGLPGKPESELRVCATYCPAVLGEMPSDLQAQAMHAEAEFHALLEHSPGFLDHVRGALETMTPELGGRA